MYVDASRRARGVTSEVDDHLQHCLRLLREIQRQTERLTSLDVRGAATWDAESLQVDVAAIVNQVHLTLRQMQEAVSFPASSLVRRGGPCGTQTVTRLPTSTPARPTVDGVDGVV